MGPTTLYPNTVEPRRNEDDQNANSYDSARLVRIVMNVDRVQDQMDDEHGRLENILHGKYSGTTRDQRKIIKTIEFPMDQRGSEDSG